MLCKYSKSGTFYISSSLQITLDDLEYLSTVVTGSNLDDAIKTGAYPSTITYHVDSNHSTTQHSLKCVIDVTGANRQLRYTLTSTAPTYKGMLQRSFIDWYYNSCFNLR